MTKLFDTATIIGIGLIGSSLARILRQKGMAEKVIGVSRSERNRQVALDLGVVDEAFADAKEAVKNADIVFLCTPVGTITEVAKEITPYLKKGAILTDVGSVKASVVKSVSSLIPEGIHFVPAHPVAGTEKSGPENGFAELFEGPGF